MSADKSDIDLLKEEYLSQIRGLFPLHRVALMFTALVVVITVQDFKFRSVSESLLNLQLRSFFDLDHGFFSSINVQDALMAISVLFGGVLLQRLIRRLFFVWVRKSLKLDEISQKLKGNSAQTKESSIAGYLAFKRAEGEAKTWAKKIASLSLVSESAATLFLTFLYAGHFGNLLDYVVAVVFFICTLFALARSFIVFLKKYLPHAVHLRGVLGIGGKVTLP